MATSMKKENVGQIKKKDMEQEKANFSLLLFIYCAELFHHKITYLQCFFY